MPSKSSTLQHLVAPTYERQDDPDLYMRMNSRVGFKMSDQSHCFELQLSMGGSVEFDGYHNVFSLNKWKTHTHLGSLILGLSGQGRVGITIYCHEAHHAPRIILSDFFDFKDNRCDIHIPDDALKHSKGLLYFKIHGLSETSLMTGGAWKTTDTPIRTPNLALIITTFERDLETELTVQRLTKGLTHSSIAQFLHLFIIDNSQTLKLKNTPSNLSLIKSENFGGSGGFTRGLLAAIDAGYSHCIFMDDDASIDFEALYRNWKMMAFAQDENLAICGALREPYQSDRLWENGATFNQRCQGLAQFQQLKPIQNIANHDVSLDILAPNAYAGWWLFGFKISSLTSFPFPFFVRGDDVSFSLANPFQLITLPGVIAEPQNHFSEKEGPLSLYLDMRSHLAHHFAFNMLDARKRTLLTMAFRFFLRSLVQCHYDSCNAITRAIEDSQNGPSYFANDPSAKMSRAAIQDMIKSEFWSKKEIKVCAPKQRKLTPNRWLIRQLMRFTLNGHLLPFFEATGHSVTLPAQFRGKLHWIWGASKIQYVSQDQTRQMTVEHNKTRALKETWSFLRSVYGLMKRRPSLIKEWQDQYKAIANENYWRELYKLNETHTK